MLDCGTQVPQTACTMLTCSAYEGADQEDSHVSRLAELHSAADIRHRRSDDHLLSSHRRNEGDLSRKHSFASSIPPNIDDETLARVREAAAHEVLRAGREMKFHFVGYISFDTSPVDQPR